MLKLKCRVNNPTTKNRKEKKMIKAKKNTRKGVAVPTTEVEQSVVNETVTVNPAEESVPAAAAAEEEAPVAVNETPKKSRTRKAAKLAPAPVVEKAPARRGRPATDRSLIMETVITALHDIYPDEVLFSRKQLSSLSVPISYILHFVKVAATPVRGLYAIPRDWRRLWPGYNEALQAALKNIYNH